MAITFTDIKPLIGATVHAARDELFTAEAAAMIRAKLEERGVLVFPGLGLDDGEQLRFTDLLGGRVKLTRDASSQETDENIYQVTLDPKINRQPEYVLGTFFYHMDGITVDMPPPLATLLSARQVAKAGGETEFASTYAAYEQLPEAEKRAIEGLRVVHSVASSLRVIADAIPEDDRERVMSIGLRNEHPLVWTRRSGRKSLVIGSSADTIVGWPVVQGRALIARLNEWAGQPAFSLRHAWQAGDFVIWDNTGALHRALPYAADSGRLMHRTSIAGVESVAA
ncbi:MAG: TauD/TfdA family dioxygenase [Sphingomonadales bacterium]|nr:TauD/TfdA family dioxygenase [Sphingomonadales bacterium]